MNVTRQKLRPHDHVVCDGPERLHAAIAPEIAAAVRAEFADRLAKASFLQRIGLHIAIRREIRRRIDAAASPTSLY